MKVKSNWIPEHSGYLTPGKEYEAEEAGDGCHQIRHDRNILCLIKIDGCAHLDFEPWEVVEEGDQPVSDGADGLGYVLGNELG